MARLNYVPLHSIIVVRDKQQIDVFEQYKKDGKAFKFEQAELDDIAATNNGSLEMSLRAPTDEAAADEAPVETKMSPGTDDASADGKKVATPPKGKDVDL